MQSTRVRLKNTLAQIGTEIRRRREALSRSQAALAAKVGVHPNVAGRIERGIHNPTVMTLEAIGAALNTSIVDLLRRALMLGLQWRRGWRLVGRACLLAGVRSLSETAS